MLECNLELLDLQRRKDIMSFYFNLSKKGRLIYSSSFSAGFIFKSNKLIKTELGDSYHTVNKGEILFEIDPLFKQFVMSHQTTMSEEFREVWDKMQTKEATLKEKSNKKD